MFGFLHHRLPGNIGDLKRVPKELMVPLVEVFQAWRVAETLWAVPDTKVYIHPASHFSSGDINELFGSEGNSALHLISSGSGNPM